jgi:hypothetical protein
MTDRASSPFARLDTNLLRSTQPQTPAPPERAADAPTPVLREVKSRQTAMPRARKLASKQSREHASSHASTLAPEMDELAATIRRTVKSPGKEVVYVRLTPEEKAQIADVVYTYKRQGVKTSDNEIGRIAVNLLMEDYRTNGENSVLAKVLAALQA